MARHGLRVEAAQPVDRLVPLLVCGLPRIAVLSARVPHPRLGSQASQLWLAFRFLHLPMLAVQRLRAARTHALRCARAARLWPYSRFERRAVRTDLARPF